jgi:hypothetical protein
MSAATGVPQGSAITTMKPRHRQTTITPFHGTGVGGTAVQ